MAKDVKKKLKRDEFDLDDELDFGDFDFPDDLEATNPKERKPVSEVFKGVISQASDTLQDVNFIKDIAERTLPKEYTTIFNAGEKITTGISKLYDQSIQEIKPQANGLARKIDKLVPKEEGFLRKIVDKLLDATGGEEYVTSGYNPEAALESSIQSTIADTFKVNQELDLKLRARDNAEDLVKENLTKKRFESEFGVLSSMSDNIARLTSYNDTITQAYQKKSLELQLRSFFVQKELLFTTKRYQETSSEQFKGIIINTALPEFTKIQKSEIMKEEMQRRLANRINTRLFGDNDWLDETLEKISSYTKEKIDEFKEGVEQASFMTEEVYNAKETMAGQSSPFKLAGGAVTSMMMDYGKEKLPYGKMSTYLNKKFPKLDETGKKLAGVIANPFEYVGKIRNSEAMEDGLYSDNLVKGMAYSVADDVLGLLSPSDAQSKINVKKAYAGDIATIDKQTDNNLNISVTEIIPGYLARIYRELQTTRLGDKTSLTVFDKLTGEFKTETALSKDILASLKKKIKDTSYGNQKTAKDFTEKLFEGQLTGEDEKSFKKLLSSFSKEHRGDSSPDALLRSESFKELSPEQQTRFKDKFSQKYNPDIDRDAIGNKNEFMETIATMRKYSPNVQTDINKLLSAGQDKELIKQGLVTLESDGKYKLNVKNYKKFLTKMEFESDEAVSDVNVKTDRKPFDSSKALTAIKNIPDFSWKYKTTSGLKDTDYKIGPMAQDVKRNLGDSVAPGGKKIDLVSLNGITMSAIKQLDDKITNVSKVKAGADSAQLSKNKINPEVQTALDIKNTLSLTEAMSGKIDDMAKLSLVQSEEIKPTKPFVKELSKSTLTIKDILKSMSVGSGRVGRKLTEAFVKKAPVTSQKVTKYITDNKDNINSSMQNLGLLAGGAAKVTSYVGKAAFDITKKLAVAYVKGIYRETKNTVIGTDLYIKGEFLPRMTKHKTDAGYYFDKASGKPISKYEDIKGDVIDKRGNIVLQSSDIAKGLVDPRGTLIKAIGRNGLAAIVKLTGLDNKFKTLMDKSGASADLKVYKDKISGSISSMVSDNSEPASVKEKEKMPTKAEKGTREERLKRIETRREQSNKNEKPSLLKGIFKSVAGKLPSSSIKSQTVATKREKIPVKAEKGTREERLKRIEDRQQTKLFNDKDGSGRRDGSWIDRLNKLKSNKDPSQNKEPNQEHKPDMTVKYREGGLLNDLLGKLSGLITGIGGLISGVGTVFRGLASVSKFVGNGIFGVGKAVVSNLPTIARALPAALTALTAGTLGGAVGAVAAVGTAALGALLSPPGIAAMVIAGAGYGLYKGYKSLTKNNLNKYELYRAYQYGFSNRPEHSQHHHKLMELEALMLDDNVSLSGDEPKISNNLKWVDIAGIFGVNEEDKEQTQKLKAWFSDRFKFFFINHLRVLSKINPKISLSKVDTLKPTELKRYLELTSFDDGPHDLKVSPVKDVAELSDNRELIKIEIRNLLAKVSNLVKTEPVKTENEVQAEKKKTPVLITKPEEDLIKPSKINKKTASVSTDSEDGKISDKTNTGKTDTPLSGFKTPGLANGPMRDGSTGMQFISLKDEVDIENLHPDVKKNLLAMAQEYGELTGKKVSLNDAFRSYQKQAEIHRRSPGTSAPPGKSLHEFGLALDADRTILNELDKMGLMKKYGFTRPVGSEPWHFEPAGIQLSLKDSKADPGKASELINYGIGRGGGGYGTIMQGGLSGRNYDMAKALLESTANGTINNQLKEDDVNIAGKAMTPKPKEEKPQENYFNNSESYDALGNFTGVANESSIKAAKAPPATVLKQTPAASYDAMGNVTGSEDGSNKPSTGNSTDNKNSDVQTAIQKAASSTGVDANLLKTFAVLESNMNPNAKNPNSSALGLFQFTKATWLEQLRKYGRKHNVSTDASPTDPIPASLMAGEYVKSNIETLSKVKPNPDDLDLYLAHFLGPAGASKFLSSHPNVPGSQLFPAAAGSNKEIFYDGRRPRTLAEIYELFKKKVNKAGGKALGQLKSKTDDSPTSTNTAVSTTATINPTENNKPKEGIQNTSYQDVPQKKSFSSYQQAPDLQGVVKTAPDSVKNNNTDLNTVNTNLGDSLNVQKQMLDVLSKIHSLIAGKSQASEKPTSEQTAPSPKMPDAQKKDTLPNPALDLRRRTV